MRSALVCTLAVVGWLAGATAAPAKSRDLGPSELRPAANGAGELAWLASPGQVRVHTGKRIRTLTAPDSCSVMAFSGRLVLLACDPAGQLLNTSTGRMRDIPYDPGDSVEWWGMGTRWLEGSGEGEICGMQSTCGVRMHRRTGRLETYSTRQVVWGVEPPDFDLNTETGAPGPQWRLTYAEGGWITAHRAGRRWRVSASSGGSAQINRAGIVGLVTKSYTPSARVYVTDPRRGRVKRIRGLRRRPGEHFSAAFPLRGKLVVVVQRYSPVTRTDSERLMETDLPF